MKLTDEIKAKIDDMNSNGIGARLIAKELNLPFHTVNNYISRKKQPNTQKTNSTKKISEAKNIITIIEKLNKDDKDCERNDSKDQTTINANSIKSVLSFSEMQDEIENMRYVNEIKQTLIDVAKALSNAIKNDEIINKDNLKQIRTLSEAAVSISTIDRNSAIKIKEIAMTEAGVRSAELSRKNVKNVDDNTSTNLTTLIKLGGVL